MTPDSFGDRPEPEQLCHRVTDPAQAVTDKVAQPRYRRNYILTPPPESQFDLDMDKPVSQAPEHITSSSFAMFGQPQRQNGPERGAVSLPGETSESKEGGGPRVKGKVNKKGKRDGENIRTYARYDSVIQALEEELVSNKIIPTAEDNKLLEQFQMKSKRSLERFFFYLLLAKREKKLGSLLEKLKEKIMAKVHEKVGHRTQQFLKILSNCIEKYIWAAQKLEMARNREEARKAFSSAYLDEVSEGSQPKRPHHNKVKGIQKCLQIYSIIIENQSLQASVQMLNELNQDKQVRESSEHLLQSENQSSQQNKNYSILQQPGFQIKSDNKIQQENLEICRNHKKRDSRVEDESYSLMEEQEVDNLGQRRKKIGFKNKKQDDRDIQKYAKFDIVSESSLQFLKKEKLHKSIPEICRKLSQRSLHFFFVILALIQKQKMEGQFLTYLESNYEKKVRKRYLQRSEYFRERLFLSFTNLIKATSQLFKGNIDEALDIAYEVKAGKKPHPAKACQQKKCKQIYEMARRSLLHLEPEHTLNFDSLLTHDKTHRNNLIKSLRGTPAPRELSVSIPPLSKRLEHSMTLPQSPTLEKGEKAGMQFETGGVYAPDGLVSLPLPNFIICHVVYPAVHGGQLNM